MNEIYLAGGCFWGLQKYLSLIPGVISTEAGYANGTTQNPTYEDVCYNGSGHAETVKTIYDGQKLPLFLLLEMYYKVIDPLSLNYQGNDIGPQYRTGIYYTNQKDKETILHSIDRIQAGLQAPAAIEVKPLENYYPAEDYHQNYLDKNPGGYCHIGPDKFEIARRFADQRPEFSRSAEDELKARLTPMQFNVTRRSATEPPFQNEYNQHFEPGIYVDITTGEPLFLSSDKFESGCGWPSFARPISPELIENRTDTSHGMVRTEVRSRLGDAHLGHVFEDGPEKSGGLRYCINSASLKFIPKNQMKAEGYGLFAYLLED